MDTMLARHFQKLNRREKIATLKRIAAGSLKLIAERQTVTEFFVKDGIGWKSQLTGEFFNTQGEAMARKTDPGVITRTVFFEDYSDTN